MTEQLRVIEAYRAIDPAVAVGRIPLSVCHEIAAPYQDAARLDPGTALDLAWLRLETGLAIKNESGSSDKNATKQVRQTLEQTRADFRGVIKDEAAPSHLHAKAMIDQASVGQYAEAAPGTMLNVISKQHLPYVRGLQLAARYLLAQPTPTTEDLAAMEALVPMYLLSEFAVKTGWVLPAAPRQPWDISLINRKRADLPVCAIAVTDDARDDVVTLSPDLWRGDTPIDLLRAIATYRIPGFATKIIPKKEPLSYIF